MTSDDITWLLWDWFYNRKLGCVQCDKQLLVETDDKDTYAVVESFVFGAPRAPGSCIDCHDKMLKRTEMTTV